MTRLFRPSGKRRGEAELRVAVIAYLLERDGDVCSECEKPIEPEDLSIDHKIPVKYGGQHRLENLRLLHHACNSRVWANMRPPMTVETKKKIGEAAKLRIGWHHSAEVKAKIALAAKIRGPRANILRDEAGKFVAAT